VPDVESRGTRPVASHYGLHHVREYVASSFGGLRGVTQLSQDWRISAHAFSTQDLFVCSVRHVYNIHQTMSCPVRSVPSSPPQVRSAVTTTLRPRYQRCARLTLGPSAAFLTKPRPYQTHEKAMKLRFANSDPNVGVADCQGPRVSLTGLAWIEYMNDETSG